MNYTTNPQLLVLFASVTSQALIDVFTGAPLNRMHQFTNGDNIKGVLYVVDQLVTPTGYNFFTMTASGSRIALTDGLGAIYTEASAVAYTPPGAYPFLSFTLNVTSAALTAALAAATLATNINAFFECRIILPGTPAQTEVVCSDQCQIFKTSLYP